MSTKKFNVGEIEIGGDQLFLISGPCVIENEKLMMNTAEELKRIEENIGVPIIYKSSFMKDNRSDATYYMGPGIDEGLKILNRIKKEFSFPILSDIHYPDQVAPAAEVLDILQIPAYLCMQTTLVLEAANSGKSARMDLQLRSPHDPAYTRCYKRTIDQDCHPKTISGQKRRTGLLCL